VIEIAERLGTSPKAAESLLTRARAAFRDAFAAIAEAAPAKGRVQEDPIRS
jgi:DNA-directed RNA polymerase specialized sigma24 family protein